MSDKPDLDLSEDDSGFSDDYLEGQTDREKQSFGTRLRADLIEKLRAAAYHDGLTITELVNRAVAEHLKEREDRRGKPYEVQPTQKVEEN